MDGILKYLTFFLILLATKTFSQISPGELSQAHAHLEGMSNCTSCHDIGKKVTNTKCLDCHTEIKTLISQKKGFHANASTVNKNCIECHSDHHGRKFDMARFDKKTFNHSLTGYALEGKHKVIDCKQCHTSENIHDPEIKKKQNTFLGLETECLSCHDDYHQKTLSNECTSCHNMEAFKPVTKFDHNKARFQLSGKHKDVDCKECHKITTRNGKQFQEFVDIPFNDCKTCHNDPHSGQIKGKCSQCHTETLFSDFKGKGRFNHNVTNFTLKGKHKEVDCFKCHKQTNDPKTVFRDKKAIDEKNCIACHKDVHENKFGNDCAKCHNESGFLSLNSMDFFDHSKTDYPLEGKHREVDCKKCHTGRYSNPIDFSACRNCHKDYHKGEFQKNGISPDCNQCHSLENGFDYSMYTIEKHQATTFPLKGAHIATPCFACHLKQDKWTFRNLGTKCVDCHEDIHQGHISEKYYPDNTCEVCHDNDSWSSVIFNHNLTDWPLDGKHAGINCRDCHFKPMNNNITKNQSFNTLSNNCSSCHENIHDDQFAIDGVTDCARCHVADSWFPKKFDHDKTAFPLEGKHAEIDCKECHKPGKQNEETVVTFKIEKFKCIDCHQ